MRVLHLISSNGFYGAEGIVATLARESSKLGCEVFLAAFNAKRPECDEFSRAVGKDGRVIWDVPCSGRATIRTLITLALLLRRERIDILHTHGYKADLYGWIAARLARRQVVATAHNWTNATRAIRVYAAMDRWLLRYFDFVATVSPEVTGLLSGRGGFDKRLAMIRNGVDLDRFADARGKVAAPMIGVIARLSVEKGIDLLIEALALVRQRFPGVRCMVAGDGPERAALTSLAERTGVLDVLDLRGFCSDTAAFLSECQVVVQPSRTEGMPLSILEAMAAGKPVVATAVGSVTTLLRNGEAGLLVPPEDPAALSAAMIRLLEDAELRGRLGDAAALEVQSYSSAAMALAYQDVYLKVLMLKVAADSLDVCGDVP